MSRLLLAFLVAFSLLACQDNEPDSPEVITLNPQQVGTASAVLEAKLKEPGPIRPIKYGFLWDVQSNLTTVSAAHNYVAGSSSDPQSYSILVDGLSPGTTYYYCGFAANSDFTRITYGKILSFTTLP